MHRKGHRNQDTGGEPPAEKKEAVNMAKYVCTVCGYVYDEAVGEPDNGIAAGTK